MVRYVALLRGINVGGKNLIKMPALKACFEEHGLERVSTYIASGNVLFESPETDAAELGVRIEELLSETFGYAARVVLRNRRQMKSVVERAPGGFGDQLAKYRYDVIFVKEPLTPKVAMKSVLLKEGVDEAYVGPGVLYFSRLIEKASSSRLARLAALPIYASMTVRNWNTTTKLCALME